MVNNRDAIKKAYREQEVNNLTGLDISNIGVLCQDKDIEIESKFGLDHNSLIRLNNEYYIATKKGKKVELPFERVQNGNVMIYMIEPKKIFNRNEKLKNDLKDFIFYLEYYLNRFGYQSTAKDHQWKISIDSKKLELPLTHITYSELSRALERILEQVSQQNISH